MIAEIVGVGTELLLGQIANTNAQYLSKRLAALGVDVYHHVVVGDNEERLAEAVRQALLRSDVVLTTGGLGPTLDDVTRDAVAKAIGRDQVFDESVWREIEGFFRRAGREPSQNNRRQAQVIKGSIVLPNTNGTAPGLIVELSPARPGQPAKAIILLPGPPRELIPMFEAHVEAYLRSIGAGAEVILSRTLKVCSMGESLVEERLRDLMESGPNPTLAPYAYPGEVHLRITAKASDEGLAMRMIRPVEEEIRARIGRFVFGADETTLEQALGLRLESMRLTIGLAESCTGGLVGERITSVPGSSRYFRGGVVAYDNSVKTSLLGVSAETLEHHGAVSIECAKEMAEGARKVLDCDLGLSITGIAGPEGGTPEKPVGTVFVWISGPLGDLGKRYSFWGGRQDVRWRASQEALALAWRYLAKE